MRPKYSEFIFDGWFNHPGGTIISTKSYITEYDPYVYNPANDTSQWVMLVDSTKDPDWYAQIGWLKNTTRKMFVESTWRGANPPYYHEFPAAPVGNWTKSR